MDNPPRQLIISLYGLYARDEGNWLSVRSLIALMGEFDVGSPAVRSSVSRLKKRGMLSAERRGGLAGYVLPPATQQVIHAGDARIWHRPRATAADGWMIVMFSVPEEQRSRRHALRSLLTRLGFGTVGSGVYVAPGTLHAEAQAALDREGLAGYTQIFVGATLVTDNMSEQARHWWDLEALRHLYIAFNKRYEPVRRRLASAPPGSSREAYATYVPMLTTWRRMPYLDPGLPAEYLPRRWPGITAARLFHDLDQRLRQSAAVHAHGVIHGQR